MSSVHPSVVIAPTAQVAPTAEIAADVVIGDYSIIEGDVQIGPRCRIDPPCGYQALD